MKFYNFSCICKIIWQSVNNHLQMHYPSYVFLALTSFKIQIIQLFINPYELGFQISNYRWRIIVNKCFQTRLESYFHFVRGAMTTCKIKPKVAIYHSHLGDIKTMYILMWLMDACHLVFKRSWQFDKDTYHFRRKNIYINWKLMTWR